MVFFFFLFLFLLLLLPFHDVISIISHLVVVVFGFMLFVLLWVVRAVVVPPWYSFSGPVYPPTHFRCFVGRNTQALASPAGEW